MDLPINLIESRITRGAILHSEMFEEIDHGKFFVIVGISGDCVAGFFFINSNIHPSLYRKPEQLALQYPMRQADYPFLRYDSFLCATNIITRKRSDLAKSIQNGISQIIGTLKPEHTEEILDAVRNSRLFSKHEKEQFFYPD